MTHFHVMANMPGYLPEADPLVVETREEADIAAADFLNSINFRYIVDVQECNDNRVDCDIDDVWTEEEEYAYQRDMIVEVS